MYHLLQTYKIKQPAMPLSPNSKRTSAQIIVRPARAEVGYEGIEVESREIN